MTNTERQRSACGGGAGNNEKTSNLGGVIFNPSPNCVSEGVVETSAKSKGLRQKAVKGVAWSALQRYSTMLIQFVSGIILARLLTPYDYGCIGMLMIFMLLAESFIDGGFGSALIQKKQPTQEDYSTIFFWNLGMAMVLYTVLFFSAPAIASFYDIPLLCDVLRVQGIILFIYAFNIVQRNQPCLCYPRIIVINNQV